MTIRRYVLTGAPGAGKTTLAEALAARGHCVVREAATDVVAQFQDLGIDDEQHRPQFLQAILDLQLARMAGAGDAVQILDRSPLCTVALARWLAQPEPRVDHHQLDREVLLVRPLGFLQKTAVRRISYPESLRFAAVHEQVYRERGFRLIDVPPGPVPDRVALVESVLAAAAT